MSFSTSRKWLQLGGEKQSVIAQLPRQWESKAGGSTFVVPESTAMFLGLCPWKELERVRRVRQCCLNPSYPVLTKRRKYSPFL